MGASDLTTEAPGTGNGEAVDGDPPVAAPGYVAKKRKRQKALAAAAANGHVSTTAQRRNGASNGAVVADELDGPVDELDVADPVVADIELPAVEEAVGEELDDADVDEAPADGGRKARRRATKHARDAREAPAPERGREAKRASDDRDARALRRAAKRARDDRDVEAPRGRAGRHARAAQLKTPAARRARLVATAAGIAAAAAEAEGQPASMHDKRAAKIARRLAALIALAMIPAAVYALVVVDRPGSSLSRVDASYMSAQLKTADQRVRARLVRLRPGQTSAALARTREAMLTTRSLTLELANAGGQDADRLRRALTLDSAWLDAVGSVLSNPRSPLRDELVARDAELRPALSALPVRAGRRRGGSRQLLRYATARVAAKRR